MKETPLVVAWAKGYLRRLDLRSFPSSLFRISDEEKHTLFALYPENNLISDDTTTLLETEDWIFRLKVVAIVTLNDNEIPDWVVWVSDEAKQGSYRSYDTLIIYDPVVGDPLIATPFSLKGTLKNTRYDRQRV